MLKLYKKAYNLDGCLHKLFYDFSDYVRFMGTPFMQFELTDYRINRNEIAVKTSANEADVDEILYAIDDRRDAQGNGYYRCYIVNYGVVQSGYITLSVAVDWWGSYIARISNEKLHVTRCNRNVGSGIYDDIKLCSGTPTATPLISGTPTASDLYIVYVVNGATGNSTFLSGAGSFLKMYATSVSRFGEEGSTDLARIYDAIRKVQGIYEVDASGQIFAVDSKPVKAYLIPRAVVEYHGGLSSPNIIFNTKSLGTTTETIAPDTTLTPENITFTYNVTFDPDKDYFLGTKTEGLKLKRTTVANSDLNIEYNINWDGLKIIARQGYNSLDITSSFEIPLTFNSANITTLEAVKNAIGMAATIADAGTQFTKGEYNKTAAGLAKAASGIFTPANANYIGGGNGIITHVTITGTAPSVTSALNQPYQILTYSSIDNEKEKARHTGATFDEYHLLSSIPTYDLLGSDTSFTHTYVEGDEFLIEGIPAEAATEIKRRLQNGIYFDEIVYA